MSGNVVPSPFQIRAMRHTGFSTLTVLALLSLAACGGSSKPAGYKGRFVLQQITTGQGQVYPYRIRAVDGAGNPTTEIINIESEATLQANANQNNGVLPVAVLPDTPLLSSGAAGNNFLYFRFSHTLMPESILSPDPAAGSTSSGLTTAISILAYDKTTEESVVLRGRGFVGGKSYYGTGTLELIEAVKRNGDNVEIADSRAQGFPRGFTGDVDMVEPNAFVFVADTDNNLSTFETFDPLDRDHVIQIRVSNSVRDGRDGLLEVEVSTATTVGLDPTPADVIGWSGARTISISPGSNQSGVDPQADISITFNKPVQPVDIGAFFTRSNLTPPSGGIALNVTVAASQYSILYYADPVSYADLCSYRIRPAYNMPSTETITVQVQSGSIHGIKDVSLLGHDVSTAFTTGAGPGIVNAPVAPDAIYVGVGGAQPGLAIIDLNGYGQGTNGLEPDANGNPTKDPATTWFARFNPNLGQPGLSPPLQPGSGPLDAGSNGPLTLVEDTRGNTKLLRPPQVSAVNDIHLGCPLDLVFNNSNINVNASGANQVNPVTALVAPGNGISVSPHPNPPRLVYPPPNASRAIFAEEPTSAGGANLLNPGNRPDFRIRAITGFVGPQPPPPSPPPPPAYLPYFARQQLGHFMYVLDRENRRIVVLNSNRMTILDTIRLPDPYQIAFSPSLSLMAVSNFASASVSFVDTDPRSPTFHQIVGETRVDAGPSEIAWQPDGDAICVVCASASSLAVISAADFTVQKIVSGNIIAPIDLAVTPRYINTGNQSGVYYAYVLNANGTVAIYESGPDGTKGIGFNNMIGLVGPVFARARAITIDYTSLIAGFWVSHVDAGGTAIVSRCEMTASPVGQLPITQQLGNGIQLPPTFRQKDWTVTSTYGGSDPLVPINDRFSGNSIADVAVDEMFNTGTGTNQVTPYNGQLGASILSHSSKGALVNGGPPFRSSYLFVALSDTGKIDVFDLVAHIKVTTIDMPGVALLSTYWRQ
ncbi:MAG: Ig-like domain-containing protein [Planctomycetes bacterium]|nr:Ig-like domain-containing protein [Planctomycetota bacterium]